MSTAYLEGLLRDVFAAQGAVDAEGLARKAAASFDLAQRDAKIYDLRGTMTEAAIAERFQIGKRYVQKIVQRQLLLRKSRR
jgi:hypothetical protein